MRGRTAGARARRVLLCLGLGALSTRGTIKVVSPVATVVVGVAVAVFVWIVADTVDEG